MTDQTRPEYVCPACGGSEFELVVTQLIDVLFYSDGDHAVTDGPRGDMEWGDDTQALCRGCGWADILREAKPA